MLREKLDGGNNANGLQPGKSSITLRLVRSQWMHEYDPTIGERTGPGQKNRETA